MRKFLMGGPTTEYWDPTLTTEVSKFKGAKIANTDLVSAGISSITLSKSSMRYNLTRTNTIRYSGVSCIVNFTIDNIAYERICYSYYSCIHIDLSDILNDNSFINILLLDGTPNTLITYSISKDVVINDVSYRFGSEKRTKIRAQYIERPASLQIIELEDNTLISAIAYNEKTGAYLAKSNSYNDYGIYVYYSPDGITWTRHILEVPLTTELPDLDATYRRRSFQTIDAVEDGFVIISNGTRIDNEYCSMYHYTTDAQTWKSGPMPRPSGSTRYNGYTDPIQKIGNKYVLVAQCNYSKSILLGSSWSMNTAYATNWGAYTLNGYDWHIISFPVTCRWNTEIVEFNNKYFITSSTGIKNSSDKYDLYVLYSSDLINWNSVALPCNTSEPATGKLVHANGIALLVNSASNHSGGDYVYFYSTNGTNWTKQNTPIWEPYYTYGDMFLPAQVLNGRFILPCRGRDKGVKVFYSTDALNWTGVYVSGTESSTSFSGPFYLVHDVLYTILNNVFVYTTDGVNWSTNTLPVATSGKAVYAYGLWMLGGSSRNYSTDAIENKMVYSFNGITWYQMPLVNLYQTKGWAFLGNKWCLTNSSNADGPAIFASFIDGIHTQIWPAGMYFAGYTYPLALEYRYSDNTTNGPITVNYNLGSGISKLVVQVNDGLPVDITSTKSINCYKGDTIISTCTLDGTYIWKGWKKPQPYSAATGAYVEPMGAPQYYVYRIPEDSNVTTLSMTAVTTLTSSGGGGSGGTILI